MQTQTQYSGMVAWFVCRHGRITDDVMMKLTVHGASLDEGTIAKKCRNRAARRFKRHHELHPCVKVDCELQAVMPEGAA